MLDEASQRRKLKTHVQTNWRRHYIKLLIGPCKICFWVTGELDLSSKTLEYQLNWMLQKKWEKSRGFLLNSPLGLSGTNPLSIQRWSSRTHVPGDPFLENKLHRVVTYHFVILRSWETQKHLTNWLFLTFPIKLRCRLLGAQLTEKANIWWVCSGYHGYCLVPKSSKSGKFLFCALKIVGR